MNIFTGNCMPERKPLARINHRKMADTVAKSCLLNPYMGLKDNRHDRPVASPSRLPGLVQFHKLVMHEGISAGLSHLSKDVMGLAKGAKNIRNDHHLFKRAALADNSTRRHHP